MTGTSYYYVSQTINNCESPRAEIQVVVYDLPTPLFDVDVESGCAPLCVQFYDGSTSASSSLVSWQWTSDGQIISDDTNPSTVLPDQVPLALRSL